MVDLVVIRGAGDKPGNDISSELITSDAVAVSRGRAELDQHSSALQEVSLTLVYTSGIKLGEIVQVHNQLEGYSWKGKVIEVSHSAEKLSGPRLTTNLVVQRVTDYYY